MMVRGLDIAAVLGASLALHVGAFAWLGLGASQGGGAGAEGASSFTVAAISPGYQSLAEAWQNPPDARQSLTPSDATSAFQPTQSPSPIAEPPATPPRPAPIALPDAEITPQAPLPIAPRMAAGPEAIALPAALGASDVPTPSVADARTLAPPSELAPAMPDAAPTLSEDLPPVPESSTDPGVARSPRPVTRPADAPLRPPEPANAPARPAQVASGSGGGSSEGNTSVESTPAPGPPDPAVMASWGGRIAARIAAGVPRTEATGQVTVQITVARDGRLQSVAVTRSSGNPDLDRAAIQVVQRAGRFPRAPSELQGETFRFNVPLRFT